MTTSLTPQALVKIVCMTNKGCKLQYAPANQDALQQGLSTMVSEHEDALNLICPLLSAAEHAVRHGPHPEDAAMFEATHEHYAGKLEAIREGRGR